ncbi:hypothetical protein D9M68_1004920 [compost metagenome]
MNHAIVQPADLSLKIVLIQLFIYRTRAFVPPLKLDGFGVEKAHEACARNTHGYTYR